jgi:hypothetical protein
LPRVAVATSRITSRGRVTSSFVDSDFSEASPSPRSDDGESAGAFEAVIAWRESESARVVSATKKADATSGVGARA